MLPHQLMDADDFIRRCGYCGKSFQNIDDPLFARRSGKEYLIFTCGSGHEHSIDLDMGDARHGKWIEENIMDESVQREKEKNRVTIENKLRE
jgi:hypothetical protein